MDKQLSSKEVFNRFSGLNQVRLARAQQVMGGKHQRVLDMLPLLFHINHQLLPGYVDNNTPAGVYNFQTNEAMLKRARQYAPSFQFNAQQQTRSDIDALYLMGSCGSIAHSRLSDFDVWLCHHDALSDEQIQNLQQKANKISKWAEVQGVELYFFVMSAKQFHDNNRPGLSGEDCGSTQHKLLLDEFYRTGLLLAGKPPLWWYIHPKRDDDYENAYQDLLESRQLNPNDTLDFGPLDSIPHSEFAGAGVWQMYKAIDSPYKSMIKILLSEVYAWEERPQPLARDFKKFIYDNRLHPDELDPYVMIYRRIERYLLAQKNTPRLDFIRRCFYAKIGIPLSQLSRESITHWRQQLIRNLIDQWGWGDYQLMELDERTNWPIERVIEEQDLLVGELQNSYQLLLKLVSERNIQNVIDQRELQILGNKLSAWYDNRAEKIMILSHAIGGGHNVEKLIISRNDEGEWLLHRPQLQSALYRTSSLHQLLCWSEANKLANNFTQYFVDPSCGDLQAQDVQVLRRRIQDIIAFLDEPSSNDNFAQEEHFLACLFIIDSRASSLNKDSMLVSNSSDVLKFGGAQHNLLHRIDIIVCSSWHGLYCYSFAGNDSVAESLCFILNNSVHAKRDMPEAFFTSFANQATSFIQRYRQVFNELDHAFIKSDHYPRFVMEIEQEYFILEAAQQEVMWRKFSSRSKMFNYLGLAREHYSPIVLEHSALRDTPLSALLAIFKKDLVQVFYQINADKAAVFINDEMGSFFTYYTQFHNPQALMQPLFRFLNNIRRRQQTPQLEDGRHLYFYEVVFNRRVQRYIVDPTPADMSIIDNMHFEVQAKGLRTSQRNIAYDITCGDQTFRYDELGQTIYLEVANFILRQRANRDRYPIYLTDINLSECSSHPENLQTIVYIQHKQKIEHQLNQALNDIE